MNTQISVNITAHNEGRLAHHTVQSALRAANYARARGLQVELIAVLDKASPQTREYFQSVSSFFSVIEQVQFGDLGLSRNHAIQKASGQYIAILDADDLICENWLYEAWKFSQAHPTQSLVLHFERSLVFGNELMLDTRIDSTHNEYSFLNLVDMNYWNALCFAPRDLFLQGNFYQVTDLRNGFGYEDWHWICETIARGAVHRIVPETVCFVRRKTIGSLLSATRSSYATMRPSSLFDLPDTEPDSLNIIAATTTQKNILKKIVREGFYRLLKVGKKITERKPRIQRFGREVLAAAYRLRKPHAVHDLPAWLMDEWRAIHNIEPELFPSQRVLDTLDFYRCPTSRIAPFYPALYHAIGASPTHVFLLPWLARGGADLETIHLMHAILRETPDARITCITTEDAPSPWISRLPEGTRVVEMARLVPTFERLALDEKVALLLRLLLQKKPVVIHNSNSALGYEIFARHGRALATQSRLYASVYCEDISSEGETMGYAFSEIPRCYDVLNAIVSDNERFVKKLCELYAFERDKFHVLAFPAPEVMPHRKQRFIADNRVLDVLWAGRFDEQKRPDVLLRIAQAMVSMPIRFHVYGNPLLDSTQQKNVEAMRAQPNVVMYGSYASFESIPTANYDIFLYTSQADGLPNVLLEAVACGLPVIAPDVGGISELINQQTGFLVSRCDAVQEYTDVLQELIRDFSRAEIKAEDARSLVCEKHSWTAFQKAVRQVPGYLFLPLLAE